MMIVVRIPQTAFDLVVVASAWAALGTAPGWRGSALTGALLAIGYLRGRAEPGGDSGPAFEAAAALRSRFIEAFGSTNCAEILERFGEQKLWIECRRLNGTTAGMAWDILRQGESVERETSGLDRQSS